jgi:ADP-ribosylglycohydrolase
MKLLGSIAGDVIGSVYERRDRRIKTTTFPLFVPRSRFTDDTVLTVATMECLLSSDRDYTSCYRKYARNYPDSGYGLKFRKWMTAENPKPYYSWGNGSAMRVGPIGWVYPTLGETLSEAQRSASVTHNHPEGVKGAQATAGAVFLARTGKSKQEIRAYIEQEFGYDLGRSCDEIRPSYSFDSSCQGSVPEAIIAFLESEDFEGAIRLAVSLGGDSDTLAAITGGIAEAFYGSVPPDIAREVEARLPNDFKNTIKRLESVIDIP